MMINKEESTKIFNFMAPEATAIVLGCGHISHGSYNENALFLKKSSSLILHGYKVD